MTFRLLQGGGQPRLDPVRELGDVQYQLATVEPADPRAELLHRRALRLARLADQAAVAQGEEVALVRTDLRAEIDARLDACARVLSDALRGRSGKQ